MGLTSFDILLFLNLPKIGLKKATSLVNEAIEKGIVFNDDMDYLNFYEKCKSKGLVYKTDIISIDNITKAKEEALSVFQKSEENGIGIVSFLDKDFPVNLKFTTVDNKEKMPLILYYKGDIAKLNTHKAVAIIGTRKVLPDGILAGQYTACLLANENYNIVSGLALGCDTVAHQGALEAQSGFTTAILAHGLDTVYPKKNQALAQQILDKGGVLLSEYPTGTPLRSPQLVARDRLQAALGDATIVIHTAIKGGTMYAANATVENNKPLFVINYKNEQMNNHENVQGNFYLQQDKGAIALSSDNLEQVKIQIQKRSDLKSKQTIQTKLF